MAAKNKSTPLVGIDISSTAVKVIQLSQSGDRYRIEGYGVEPLQPGQVSDKTIAENESENVAKAIASALKKAGIKTKSAAVSVAGSGVITKVIHVPGTLKGLSEEDLQSQVELEAGNQLPFPLEEVRMDYAVLGQAKDAEVLDVLLAAARSDAAQQVQEVVEAAGLTVEVMDIESLAMETSYAIVAKELNIPATDIVALFDIGATAIVLNVMRGGQSIYQRHQDFDARVPESEIRRQLGCSQEQALRHLRLADYPSEFEDAVLEPFRESLCQTLSRLLQYFYSGSEYNTVNKILLAGGGANTRGLVEVIDDRLGIPSHVANPLAGMSLGSALKGKDLSADATSLFLATGLALRAFPMGSINLMPWREKRRKERQKAFMTLLGLSAAAALAVVVAVMTVQSGQISNQEERNQRLEAKIEELKAKAARIQDLDIKRERLLGRKQVIEELQSNRSQMVHLFDQIVRTVPEGVQLLAVQQTGEFLVIEGRSESNSRVSQYLRSLELSGWMSKPDLQIIEEQIPAQRAADDVGATGTVLPYFFRVRVVLANPNAAKEGEEGVEAPPADVVIAEPPVEPLPGQVPETPVAPTTAPEVPVNEVPADPALAPVEVSPSVAEPIRTEASEATQLRDAVQAPLEKAADAAQAMEQSTMTEASGAASENQDPLGDLAPSPESGPDQIQEEE